MHTAGLVSVSFRTLSAEEIIAAAKVSDLNFIEWGSDIHAPYSDVQKLKHIAELCNSNGIICSYGSYFRFGRDNIKDIRQYIKAAQILGAKFIRVWCGTKGSREYTASELDALYTDCKYAAKIAAESGITLGMECHNWTLTDSKESALALIKEVNSPAFKMYWQPNQFKTIEENIDYAKIIAPYTICIHAFNWKQTEKFSLALAKDEWLRYLQCFQSNIPVLLEFMPDDKLESLPNESKTLHLLLNNPSITKF